MCSDTLSFPGDGPVFTHTGGTEPLLYAWPLSLGQNVKEKSFQKAKSFLPEWNSNFLLASHIHQTKDCYGGKCWKNTLYHACTQLPTHTHTQLYLYTNMLSLISLSFCSSAWTRRCDSKWPEGATGSAWLNCHFMCSATRIHLDTNTHTLVFLPRLLSVRTHCTELYCKENGYWWEVGGYWGSMASFIARFRIYTVYIVRTFRAGILEGIATSLGFVLVLKWTWSVKEKETLTLTVQFIRNSSIMWQQNNAHYINPKRDQKKRVQAATTGAPHQGQPHAPHRKNFSLL